MIGVEGTNGYQRCVVGHGDTQWPWWTDANESDRRKSNTECGPQLQPLQTGKLTHDACEQDDDQIYGEDSRYFLAAYPQKVCASSSSLLTIANSILVEHLSIQWQVD